VADVSVLALERGEFGFLDVAGKSNPGSQKLGCEISILKGLVMWDLNARVADRWNSNR
jgi:dihydroorotase